MNPFKFLFRLLFRPPSVGSLVANLHQLKDQLRAVAEQNDAMAHEHRQAAVVHEKEADHANRVATNLHRFLQ